MSFLGNLGKKAIDKAYGLAAKVEGGRDYLTTAANTVNSLVKGKDPRVYLKPGNVIQFISRASARSIQIVVAKDTNELICDAIGGSGQFFPNAYWLVVCAPNNRYFFHNNYNYLAIKNGKATIIPSSMNEKAPSEGEFRVQDVLGSTQAIYLESVQYPGTFICFDDDGNRGDETRSKVKDRSAQLEIQLIAYGPGIQPEKDDTTIEAPSEAAPPPYWAAAATSPSPSSSGDAASATKE